MNVVQKPGRYAGGEWNTLTKNDATASIALAFPDVYEIGMSHLGLRLLYEAVNRDPRFAAERVYAPWPDRTAALQAAGAPLTTLESGRAQGMVPLNDALAGFVQSGVVDVKDAYRQAVDRPAFLAVLRREGVDTSFAERLT